MRLFPHWLSATGVAALLLGISPVRAVLVYNIYEIDGDVIVATNGSLMVNNPIPNFGLTCLDEGSIISADAAICTGPDSGNLPIYALTGPESFNGTVNILGASSVSGIATSFIGATTGFGSGLIGLPSTYIPGSQIVSSARFDSTTLAALGFTTTGPIGTWTLIDGGDTINVVLGPPQPVPAPLPLLGAGTAFAFSRRLRRRINLNRSASSPHD